MKQRNNFKNRASVDSQDNMSKQLKLYQYGSAFKQQRLQKREKQSQSQVLKKSVTLKDDQMRQTMTSLDMMNLKIINYNEKVRPQTTQKQQKPMNVKVEDQDHENHQNGNLLILGNCKCKQCTCNYCSCKFINYNLNLPQKKTKNPFSITSQTSYNDEYKKENNGQDYKLKFTIINKEWGEHPHNTSSFITLDTTSKKDYNQKPAQMAQLKKMRAIEKLYKPMIHKQTNYVQSYPQPQDIINRDPIKNMTNDVNSYFVQRSQKFDTKSRYQSEFEKKNFSKIKYHYSHIEKTVKPQYYDISTNYQKSFINDEPEINKEFLKERNLQNKQTRNEVLRYFDFKPQPYIQQALRPESQKVNNGYIHCPARDILL